MTERQDGSTGEAATGDGAAPGALRARVLAGGRFLLAREVLGIVVRSAGLLLLTRLLGPREFGLFAGPNLVIAFLAVVATTGADVFLIRRSGDVEPSWFHQVFTYLLVSSGLLALAVVALAPLCGGLLADPRAVAPLQVLAISLPVNVLWIPAKAVLERELDFRRLARVEVGSDVAQYVVALGLAAAGAGVWAAVYGFLARQLYALVAVHVLSGYRPRWRWDRAQLRQVLGFGWVQSSTAVANRAGDLVVPLLVGHYLGARGVGVAALTLRLADTLSFVNRATYRLSIVALSKVQNDLARLRAAVESAMSLQVLGVGPPLVLFSLAGATVVPLLLGEQWREAAALFPYVALNYLLVALFTMQVAALVVTGRNRSVLGANLVTLVLLYAAGLALIPRFGLVGYGLTETVALAGQYVNHRAMRRAIAGGVSYRSALPWLLAFVPLLFVPLVPAPLNALLVAGLVVALAMPSTRADLRAQLGVLRRRGRAAA